MPRLTVVPPSEASPAEAVRIRVRKMPKPAAMLQCHRCGGRALIETKTGVLFENGKAKGGTKQIICVACLAQGNRVVVA